MEEWVAKGVSRTPITQHHLAGDLNSGSPQLSMNRRVSLALATPSKCLYLVDSRKTNRTTTDRLMNV
ncbi:hypothetical protein KIN20_024531 [Parelaphostrongylus tenuis]|uniref:Uncharacterized protein n=1 Tax=Parelaphostrongylus tenuis TaxID=148309 RepID=A0AAD5N896_PARTN|nr:hypothetical protein KIN20_024531 [Parelaphostrongylus tenuis]